MVTEKIRVNDISSMRSDRVVKKIPAYTNFFMDYKIADKIYRLWFNYAGFHIFGRIDMKLKESYHDYLWNGGVL